MTAQQESGSLFPIADLVEWAKTTRYFQPDDFEKLAALASEVERLREYVRGLGGWLDDEQ